LKEKDWDEHEERDTTEFLELEKSEKDFEDYDEDDEEKCVEVAETTNKCKINCIEEGGFDDDSDDYDISY
jgi:hypothetical protein